SEIYTDANRKAAREIAADCFVLLKNSPLPGGAGEGILPLKKSGTIGLIGPLADAKENMPGTWSVAADFSKAISVLQGLKETIGSSAQVLYAKGSYLDYDSVFEQRAGMFGKSFNRDGKTTERLLQEALNVAYQSDVIIVALGESAEMTGESSSS